MKILLMICLLPITVCAAMPLCGFASATIENRKGICIFPTEGPVAGEDALEAGEAADAPGVDMDFDSGEETTAEEIEFDEPTVDDELMLTAEEQDLADTELFEE